MLNEGFRDFLARLRAAGQMADLGQPVNLMHLPALVDQAPAAICLHQPIGYDMQVVSGLVRTRERMLLAAGSETMADLGARIGAAIERPIAAQMIAGPAPQEIVISGDDVDLFNLPVPLSAIHDGAPTITAGVVIARDPEYGLNAGVYRLMVKQRNITGIDIVTPNNLRRYNERAMARGESLPISVSLGVHPIDMLGAGYRSPLGSSELGLAGGLRGAPVGLAPCGTSDLPYIADAEIVLEGEILPTGWTHPEGRFGEFTRLMGALHWNPLVRINAIRMKPKPIFYALHMPWENVWLGAPTRYSAIARSLDVAGVAWKDINVTLGGCAFWHAVISIRKQAGEGKNALLAALSVMDLKQVTVVDDDIDVFDPVDVEFAVATRVQADRDVVIVSNARAKPLDPSLMPTPGRVPTTAKMGIDATISEGLPHERFERIAYPRADSIDVQGYIDGKADTPSTAEDARAAIMAIVTQSPLYYSALLEKLSHLPFRAITEAVGALNLAGELWQDQQGRLCRADSPLAARVPQ